LERRSLREEAFAGDEGHDYALSQIHTARAQQQTRLRNMGFADTFRERLAVEAFEGLGEARGHANGEFQLIGTSLFSPR